MEIPFCNNEICGSRSEYYLPYYDIYKCSTHLENRDIEEGFIKLETHELTDHTLKCVEVALHKFLEYYKTTNNNRKIEAHQELVDAYQAKVSTLRTQLEGHVLQKEYFKYVDIQNEAQDLYDDLKVEDLFRKYTTDKYISGVYHDTDPTTFEDSSLEKQRCEKVFEEKFEYKKKEIECETNKIVEDWEQKTHSATSEITLITPHLDDPSQHFATLKTHLLFTHKSELEDLQKAQEASLHSLAKSLELDCAQQVSSPAQRRDGRRTSQSRATACRGLTKRKRCRERAKENTCEVCPG
ncbi:unnamed protein product [Moneuplotes crassus]|uniref:Uncharacterized protein n=1 Tax=Euplotes crassus TaxID=5936 RepID=A0AAD1U2Q8_EUPCR|nr:unnamed protein product [Moneuplotes crassus]